MKRVFLPLLAAGTVSAVLSAGELADLRAEYRDNQLFLQWRENNLSKEARLTVWRSTAPITRENLKSAECIADLLNPGSARDWWQDIDSFYIRKGNDKKSEEIFAGDVAEAGAQKKTIPGFVIKENGKPLDPRKSRAPSTMPSAGKRGFTVRRNSCSRSLRRSRSPRRARQLPSESAVANLPPAAPKDCR